MPSSSQRPFSSVKARVAMVSPEAMPGSSSFLAVVVAGVEQGVGGQHHGGEVGGAQQAPAHLLEHHDELDVAVARAAVLLGDDQALEAQLLGHLLPDGRVVALLGLHQPPDLGLGRLGLEELPTILRSSSCSSLKAKFTADVSTRPRGQVSRLGETVRRPWLTTTLHYEDAQAEIHKLVVGPVDNNVFVLRCKETGDAVLLDAANEHERLLELCQRLGVRTVLETHGHWDHIQAVPAVRDAGYEVGVTAEDAAMLDAYDYLLEDESVIEVGRLRLHTILTPGHTPGSMCFRLEGSPVLFSGDTLFPGGPGNTEFPGGDFDHDHRVDRPAPLHPARRHARPARPRRRHHDRRRAAPPPGVDRPGLVTTAEERPIDPTPVHTADLPPTPTRDRNIPATAWVEAPASLLDLGTDLDLPVGLYKRRIGRWLLWRAGPAAAPRPLPGQSTPTTSNGLHLHPDPDGTGQGIGPSGADHDRFRTWKEDLRDHGE